MKKTIITLLLISGIAQAQDVILGTLDGNYTYTQFDANNVIVNFGGAEPTGYNRPQQDDIQLMYYCQDTNGSAIWADAKGNYDGTVLPSGATGATYTNLGERADGSTNEIARYFDGIDDRINCTDIEMDGWTNLTVCAWIKTDSTPNLARILSKDQEGKQGAWILFIDVNDDLTFQVHDGTSFMFATWADYDKTDETWHHVAGVLNGADVILYFDGEEKAKVSTMTAGIDDADNEEVAVGADSDIASPRHLFKGFIDDVCIWSNALSEVQLGTLYTNTLHPTNSVEVFITP